MTDKRRQQIIEDKERLQTNAKELLGSVDGQCCRTVAKAIFDEELFRKKFTKTERESLKKKYGVERL